MGLAFLFYYIVLLKPFSQGVVTDGKKKPFPGPGNGFQIHSKWKSGDGAAYCRSNRPQPS